MVFLIECTTKHSHLSSSFCLSSKHLLIFSFYYYGMMASRHLLSYFPWCHFLFIYYFMGLPIPDRLPHSDELVTSEPTVPLQQNKIKTTGPEFPWTTAKICRFWLCSLSTSSTKQLAVTPPEFPFPTSEIMDLPTNEMQLRLAELEHKLVRHDRGYPWVFFSQSLSVPVNTTLTGKGQGFPRFTHG